jgi:hypothetical protein
VLWASALEIGFCPFASKPVLRVNSSWNACRKDLRKSSSKGRMKVPQPGITGFFLWEQTSPFPQSMALRVRPRQPWKNYVSAAGPSRAGSSRISSSAPAQ